MDGRRADNLVVLDTGTAQALNSGGVGRLLVINH